VSPIASVDEFTLGLGTRTVNEVILCNGPCGSRGQSVNMDLPCASNSKCAWVYLGIATPSNQ